MFRPPRPGRSSATRALIILTALGALAGSVVAYAQTSEADRGKAKPGSKGAKEGRSPRPPRPRLIEAPGAAALGPGAQFRFHVAPRGSSSPGAPGPAGPAVRRWRQFECRLDDGAWEGCSSPRRLVDLEPERHAFAVRALARDGRSGLAAHYSWTQLEAQPFTIEALSTPSDELIPGAPPEALPIRITNPNPEPIEVTSVDVAIAADVPGCAADPNFELIPAGVSSAAPLRVAAGGSVSLPSGGATAPMIALRELPFDQNACQGAQVQLVFGGEAHG